MEKFFILEPGEGIIFSKKWAYADIIDPVNRGDYEKCPVCGGPVGGLKWLPPHKVKLSSGRPEKFGDLLWGAGFPLLVSSKFKQIFEEEGLKGITNFSPPVDIVQTGKYKKGESLNYMPIYHLIEVPWGNAKLDEVASHVTWKKPPENRCSYCLVGVGRGKKMERIVIQANSWNGDDIFTPRGGPVLFMVSEKFKLIYEKNYIKNMLLVPAEHYNYSDLKPGSYYFNSTNDKHNTTEF